MAAAHNSSAQSLRFMASSKPLLKKISDHSHQVAGFFTPRSRS